MVLKVTLTKASSCNQSPLFAGEKLVTVLGYTGPSSESNNRTSRLRLRVPSPSVVRSSPESFIRLTAHCGQQFCGLHVCDTGKEKSATWINSGLVGTR